MRLGSHGMVANQLVECHQRANLLLLDTAPVLHALGGCQEWDEDHQDQASEDHHAFRGEHRSWLVAEPRPLQHSSILGELNLVVAVARGGLGLVAIHVDAVLLDGNSPILHLAIHEGSSGELHPGHELVQVEGGSEVEGNDIVVASANSVVLDGQPTEVPRLGLGRVASGLLHSDGQMRLLEGDVDGSDLLAGLVVEDLVSGHGRDTVLRNGGGELDSHGPGDVDHSGRGLLNEVRQILSIISVESDALEPAPEDSRLVLPVAGQGGTLDHDVGEHDVANVVPNASVDELDTPLVRQVGSDLVANLLATLVDQVRNVLPSDLPSVHIEDATRSGHVPRRGVAGSHVQDHVHVLESERARRIQELVVPVGSGEEGMILEEVDLGPLLAREVLGRALREEVEAEIVVDAEASVAGGGADVEVLMMSVGHDDLIGCHFVDLRCRNWVLRVRLQRTEKLAGEVTLHWVRVVVHQHGVLGW
mmetsp:Transcript_367/g.820  ORF Transcript_367/g.820 Transcript_367/m.820 type:complete len:476 (+) Transcript_367:459-1886(+)